jgi:group I intron endonuclease
MNKICGIYKITSPSKYVYIGQSFDIEKRFKYYKRLSCESQARLYNSLKKHGVEKHKFEIIHQCEREQLNELEIYYIELFQCFNNKHGLNIRSGGDSGGKLSEETKNKLKLLNIGKKKSEETKKKMSESHKGRPPVSCETRKKMSEAQKGKKHSPETIEKLRLINTGRKMSDEQKEKLRIAQIGKTYKTGWHHTEEAKRKISEFSKGNKFRLGSIANNETKLKMSKSQKKRWALQKEGLSI